MAEKHRDALRRPLLQLGHTCPVTLPLEKEGQVKGQKACSILVGPLTVLAVHGSVARSLTALSLGSLRRQGR